MPGVGMTMAMIKALTPSPKPEDIEGAVSDWLNNHPEATTTIEDGAITKAKLSSSLQDTVDDVADLKSAANIVTPEMYGAYGDGTHDDTQALSTAFNRSNAVIEGGNKVYKLLELTVTESQNLVIRNFRFYHGIQIKLKHCVNVIFQNCIWDEFQDNGIADKTVHGIILTTMHTGSEEWVEANNWRADEVCKNITFDNCQFIGTHYTESTPSLFVGNKPHYNTGMAIRLEGVDGLRIIGCYFTQNRGNACIQQNSYAPLGDFEIRNSLFYLNCWAGIELYRYTGMSGYPRRIIQGNRFIGHGLGYLPWSYLEIIDESKRGVGTAVLLGGTASRIQNEFANCVVQDNFFEDNNESAVEGWQWNPVKNNVILGNGVLQSAESVTEMTQKYKITYQLYVRKNPSQNPIYIGQYSDAKRYSDGEIRSIENNTIGRMYGTWNPIMIRGYFYEQVVVRNNTITDKDLYTDENSKIAHFLSCTFYKGLTWEKNIGMKPYFNACTFAGGEFDLDEMHDAYNCTFTSKDFVSTSVTDRFQQVRNARFNEEVMSLRDNTVSTVENGKPVLGFKAHAASIVVNDPVWDIRNISGYANEKYVFGGAASPTIVDTQLALGATDTNWTIFVDTTTKGDNDAGNNTFYINLLAFSDNSGTSSLQFGSRYTGQAWTYMALNGTNNKVDGSVSQQYLAVTRSSRFALRHVSGSGVIDVFARRNDASVSAFSDIDKGSFAFTSGYSATLRFGGTFAENTNAKSFYNGEMKEAKVYDRALSDAEVSVLMVGSDITVHTDPVPVYDIADESGYIDGEGLYFDGQTAIDTNIPLLENTADFTIVTTFVFDNMAADGRRPNFTFIPVFSAMSADTLDYVHAGCTDKGISVGLSMQNGMSLEDTALGGFITFRRDWRYVNSKTIDSASYNSYYKKEYTVIVRRENGVIKVYDGTMSPIKELTGDYANAIVQGNLTIGARMGYGNGYTDFFKGTISEFEVYDSAVDLSYLEKKHPSIIDNEASEKGCVIYHLSNKTCKKKFVRYAVVEINYDLGEYNSAEYTIQYPKAFGVKLNNVDDILWVPCSSSQKAKFIQRCNWNAEYDPFTSWDVEIVNPGLVPDMNVVVKGVNILLLSKQEAYQESVDASEFNVSWDVEPEELTVGDASVGFVQYVPEEATTGTALTVASEDTTVATVTASGGEVTITGVGEGETFVTVSIPYGAKHIYRVLVSAQE